MASRLLGINLHFAPPLPYYKAADQKALIMKQTNIRSELIIFIFRCKKPSIKWNDSEKIDVKKTDQQIGVIIGQ